MKEFTLGTPAGCARPCKPQAGLDDDTGHDEHDGDGVVPSEGRGSQRDAVAAGPRRRRESAMAWWRAPRPASRGDARQAQPQRRATRRRARSCPRQQIKATRDESDGERDSPTHGNPRGQESFICCFTHERGPRDHLTGQYHEAVELYDCDSRNIAGARVSLRSRQSLL